MSHTNNALKKPSKNYKNQYDTFLKFKYEPESFESLNPAMNELEADLIRHTYYQKKRFRRIARRIRQEV